MVEDTAVNVPLSPSANSHIDQIISLKKKVLIRSSSKEDSGDDSQSEKKLKRRSDITLKNESKKVKVDSVEPLADLAEAVFEWAAYLQETKSSPVPKSYFKHVVPECMCGFEPGMKLEVPNKDYDNTYWLATIITKASPLILVRYEGFKDDNSTDFWCNTLTDDIHPVGWSARTKHVLKPPKSIQDQERNWYAYLIKNLTGARKASESLFLKKSHPVHYLRAGHYVEVIDAHNPNCFWLARIVEGFSGRLNLQYEGIEDSDFWCFFTNERLKPVGFSLKNSLTLYPPRATQSVNHTQVGRITERLINLSKRSDTTVFNTLFQGIKVRQPHNLRLGMKLEAVHPNDSTKISVASVVRIFNADYFLVKIDDLITIQDDASASFVAHKDSPCIFPVGFCAQNGLVLAQPEGHIGKFTWEGYLKYTKTEPIPKSWFPERTNPAEIEVGMKLEAVDKANPANIYVCTVRKVVYGHLWLHIDGDTRGDQIYACDSHDIFPVGWCESTGHELQWPRPETLEQKNRISSLRHTATRQNRLEVLRKGKLLDHQKSDAKDARKEKDSKDNTPTNKHKRKHVYKQRRGVSRKRILNDDSTDNSSTVDTTIAFVCINRLAEEFNTEESIKKFYRLDAEGRLPKEIVTIDDDEDEDDDVGDNKTSVSKPNNEKKSKVDTEKTYTGKFSESDLEYLSFLRVKPKSLTKKECEMFEKKLSGGDSDESPGSPTSPGSAFMIAGLGGRKTRSLNSVVAMLTANKSQPRSHLLDQYKMSKSSKLKSQTDKQESQTDKQESQAIASTTAITSTKTAVIDLCNDDIPGSNTNTVPSLNNPLSLLNSPDTPINIPGKGQFRIVEQIVTKQGDKNKIILRLGKPSSAVKNNSSVQQKVNVTDNNSNKENIAAANKKNESAQSSKVSSQISSDLPAHQAPTSTQLSTNVEEMYTISNMARSHVGLDELLRNRFNKVRSCCKNLPRNPLLWDAKQVASFITNADFGKYAKLFFDQDIDGHSLLLLTVQEIHHILGIKLGPAMKIHDFVYSLQQLVDDAYMNSKSKVLSKHDKSDGKVECSAPTSSDIGESESFCLEKEVQSTERRPVNKPVHAEKLPDMSDPITAAVERSKKKVVKWIDNNNDMLEKIRIQTAFEFKSGETSLGPTYLSKQFESAARMGYVPEHFVQPATAVHIPMAPPTASNSKSKKQQTFLPNYYSHPVRFIQIQPPAGATGDIMHTPGEVVTPVQLVPVSSANIQAQNSSDLPDGTVVNEGTSEPDHPTESAGGMSKESEKHSDANHSDQKTVNKIGGKRSASSSIITEDADKIPEKQLKADGVSTTAKTTSENTTINCLASFTPATKQTYDDYLADIELHLVNNELWQKFYKTGTEMILTRTGRRMFPSFQVNITGMNDYQKYCIILDFAPVDNNRYKYEFETSRWLPACNEGTSPPTRIFVHPKYPAYGSNWMSSVVDFTRCKLTNATVPNPHILLNSMHKYQPRVHVIHWDKKLQQMNPFDMLNYGCKKVFMFEVTQFIAVTAYQNAQVTQLKINSNPFARGFRGDWRKEKERNARKKDEDDYELEPSDEEFDEEKSKAVEGGIKIKVEEIEEST